ncbi:hypothetical protein, partial [Desulfobacula sp.]|uniref:hypothetical protein n=1 Tax=Desulfobacula sp. TaxID=2593537 RepID=UPI0039B845A0
ANSKSLSIQVSILVFLDMEFRQKIQPSKLNPQEFQSLFFWIWNSDFYGPDPGTFVKSFNPCFSGYGIQTSILKISL